MNNIKICNFISFGDSNTDYENAYLISKKVLQSPNPPQQAELKPKPGSWGSRASNGILSIEVLSEKLNVPICNYAIGGALTGYKNLTFWMDTFFDTGFLGQIKKYKENLNGEKPRTCNVHVVLIGSNNFFKFLYFTQPPTIEEATSVAADEIKAGLEKLVNMGANKFFLFNFPDLSLMPFAISEGITEKAKQFSDIMNEKLKSTFENLKNDPNLDVIEYDIYNSINEIVQNPGKYSLVQVNVSCNPKQPETVPIKFYPCMASTCLFWDPYHLSRRGNEIIAENMYELIKKRGWI